MPYQIHICKIVFVFVLSALLSMTVLSFERSVSAPGSAATNLNSTQRANQKADTKQKKKSDNSPRLANPELGPETVIAELGIKIRDMNYSGVPEDEAKRRAEWCSRPNANANYCRPPLSRIPVVTAVQENSSAYFAGMAPGDVIKAIYGTPTLSSELVRLVESRRNPLGGEIDLPVYYAVSNSPYPKETKFRLPYNDTVSGRWVTEVPEHTQEARTSLPGLLEARVALRSTYEKLRKDSLASIRHKPCATNDESIRSIAGRLDQLGSWGDVPGRFYTAGIWQEQLQVAAKIVCENSSQGTLSNVEKAIVAILATESLDPCDYSPTTDYSYVFEEFYDKMAYGAREFTRSAYSKTFSSRFDTYLRKATPGKKACFINLLKSSLL